MKQSEAEVAGKRIIWVRIIGQYKGQKMSPPLGKCRVNIQMCDPTESFIPVSQDGAATQPMHNLSLCWQKWNPNAVPMYWFMCACVYFS